MAFGIDDMIIAFENRQHEDKWNKINHDFQQKQYQDQQGWNNAQWIRDEQRYQQTLQREDTAVSRRVADLKSAGLSPVLASGQGAMSGMQSPPQIRTGEAPQRRLNTPLRGMDFSMADKVANMMRMQNEISLTDQQKKLIDAQTKTQGVITDKEEHNLKYAQLHKVPTTYTPDSIDRRVSQFDAVGTAIGKKMAEMKEEAEKVKMSETELEELLRKNPEAKTIGELLKLRR